MKPERWTQVDQLFADALGRKAEERAEFLDQACAGDEALRQQVEALLAAHQDAGSFLDRPAMEVEARGVAKDEGVARTELRAGDTISHYRIMSLLGAGGMGDVYLAQDTTLGRKVALKLLPIGFTRDENRVRRFQQEARAASALNHPHIITIHEIGQTAERHFIATEFIDGETLRRRLGATSFPPDEVLSIGMQVADALAAAHAKGIVHRDIKPENIMLAKESHLLQKESLVKLLDFGIAKLAQPTEQEGEATTRVLLNTHEGSVIGTASYMSPEQARGEQVDARTDVWSLGVVLYEMLANGVPFGGHTAQDVIASILKEEPPELCSAVPDRLRWIVEKALRKEREERYQTAREMFADLRDLQKRGDNFAERAIETAETTRRTSSFERPLSIFKSHRTGMLIALTLSLVAVAGIAFGLYKFVSRRAQTAGQNEPKPTALFQSRKLTRLTSTGKATDAAISPDGRYVVHVVDDGGKQSLWLRQVSPASNRQIIPPADVYYYGGVTFSRDGQYIYYGGFEKESGFSALYQMPMLGGTARKLITDIDSLVTFSPDGKQLVFSRGYTTGETALLVANADGSAERKLASRRAPYTFGANGLETAAWSPDGKVIVCPAGNIDARGPYMTLIEVLVKDGSEKPISSERWWQVGRVAWLRDGSGLLFTARESAASPSQIWYLSYPGGAAQRITNDLHNYVALSLTADAAALVTVESEQVSSIWIAPNDDAQRAGRITETKSDGVEGLSWTPDGKIVYASRTGDNLDIWLSEANGTGQKQLTANDGNNSWPSLSPDGGKVVFTSDRTGTKHIWRMDIDGNNTKQLTYGNGEWHPQCSPNGWVAYQSTNGGQLLKVTLDGSVPVQIIQNFYAHADISPNGEWIAAGYAQPPYGIAVYPIAGGEPRQLVDILHTDYVRWTPDGRSLAYVAEKDPSEITIRPLAGGPAKRLTAFNSDRIFNFVWSRDGKQLALARGTMINDVVLINFTDQR